MTDISRPFFLPRRDRGTKLATSQTIDPKNESNGTARPPLPFPFARAPALVFTAGQTALERISVLFLLLA